MKKILAAAALGGALLSGSLLEAGAANADVYYNNCSEARAAVAAPIYRAARLPAWA